MQYHIRGIDRHTGEKRQATVEAASAEDARAQVAQQNIVAERTKEAPSPAPTSKTNRQKKREPSAGRILWPVLGWLLIAVGVLAACAPYLYADGIERITSAVASATTVLVGAICLVCGCVTGVADQVRYLRERDDRSSD